MPSPSVDPDPIVALLVGLTRRSVQVNKGLPRPRRNEDSAIPGELEANCSTAPLPGREPARVDGMGLTGVHSEMEIDGDGQVDDL